MDDEDVSYVSKLEVPLPQQQEALSNSKVPYEADELSIVILKVGNCYFPY